MDPNGHTELIERLAERVFAYAMRMIYEANHRDDVQLGDPKVGGHPASSASCLHILSALHFAVRQPQDVLAIKPHASPIDHAIGYMLRLFSKSPTQHGGPSDWLDDDTSAALMSRLRKFPAPGEQVVSEAITPSPIPMRFRSCPQGRWAFLPSSACTPPSRTATPGTMAGTRRTTPIFGR